jgi:murein DD-endopeptidase MepM/ murein hydrolase activator NlpD
VIGIGIFTTSDKIPYWNETNYVLIKNQDSLIYKYAELENITIKLNEFVKVGQVIGYVGTVLNLDKVSSNSPQYIQKMKKKNICSRLHFEVYNSKPKLTKKYHGGNWLGFKKPEFLLNPNYYI